MAERYPNSSEEELEGAIDTAGVTGTNAPAADSDAPAIADLMGSQVPGTLAPQSIEGVEPSAIDTNTVPTIDARSRPRKEQIRGALRYDPKALLSADRLTLPLPHESRIVVYADSDDRALEIAERLREQGYEQATILEGGFDAYKAAGLPVEQITEEQPIPGEEGAGIHRI